MENIWAGRPDSDKYLAMLRESVKRAARVTAQMVAEAGGATENVLSAHEENDAVLPLLSSVPKETQRIMVVDDEPVMRTLYERLLTGDGYEVIAADSGC